MIAYDVTSAVNNQAQQMFRKDWAGLHRIDVDDAVNRQVDELLTRHPLRGADAIHLASALLLRYLAKVSITFACADVALVNAARTEGLAIVP